MNQDVNSVVNKLVQDFQYLKYRKNVFNEGEGRLRTRKEKVLINYVTDVSKIVLMDSIFNDFYIPIKNHDGQKFKCQIKEHLEIELDIPIRSKKTNEYVLFLEIKDYADKCMFSRFVSDCKKFEYRFGKSNGTGLCIEMQSATSVPIKNALCEFDGISSDNFYTIFPSHRKSNQQFYVLDYSIKDVIRHTYKLCDYLYWKLSKIEV